MNDEDAWAATSSTAMIRIYGPPKTSLSTNGTIIRRRWECQECGKQLSSKRSYDEHMNIHNNARPFQCPDCPYAAASQMTLRRHRLRNHMKREEWGYRCPYCNESFMEPASYQQHVMSRHPNRSCTFGCPVCGWTCRCARYFKEHVEKHVISQIWPFEDVEELREDELQRFLVDDDSGSGFRYLSTNDPEQKPVPRPASGVLRSITKQKESADYFKEPLKLPDDVEQKLASLPQRPKFEARSVPFRRPVILVPSPLPQVPLYTGDSNWIESEIEIDPSADNGFEHVYDSGIVDNLDLD